MSLMLNLRSDVWLLWGLLATFNTALIGWLLEKGGSFRNPQKAVATAGYAVFCLVIAVGFANAYGYLAAAAADLDAAVRAASEPTPGGLIETFRRRDYTGSLVYAVAVTGASFTFITFLVWSRWLPKSSSRS
jgi:hypothetical protein